MFDGNICTFIPQPKIDFYKKPNGKVINNISVYNWWVGGFHRQPLIKEPQQCYMAPKLQCAILLTW